MLKNLKSVFSVGAQLHPAAKLTIFCFLLRCKKHKGLGENTKKGGAFKSGLAVEKSSGVGFVKIIIGNFGIECGKV